MCQNCNDIDARLENEALVEFIMEMQECRWDILLLNRMDFGRRLIIDWIASNGRVSKADASAILLAFVISIDEALNIAGKINCL